MAEAIAALFRNHFSEQRGLTDLSTIEEMLPHDAGQLRALAERCWDASREAARAGRHMEVRRMSVLARQLEQHAAALLKRT